MNTKLCVLLLVLLMGVSPAVGVVWPKTYTFEPIANSLPTVGNDADEICELGEKEAWFGYRITAIPPVEQIVSASFTAVMINYVDTTQRTLWYDSDDQWIFDRTDPDNRVPNELVGTLIHERSDWTAITIPIDISLHDWANDIADGYVSLMLTGPLSGSHKCGSVDFRGAVLELVTIPGEGNYSGPALGFGPEEIIQAGGTDIEVPGYSVPSFEDLNEDGLNDLIIGEGAGPRDNGKVRVYINVGTESDPSFSDYFYVQSNGADLVCPAATAFGCFPRVVYWDADERKDLLVGLADGTVKIYRNIGTDKGKGPRFDVDGGTLIRLGNGRNIDVGLRATPSVVDWNNDGRKDLVVGAFDGKIHIFLNQGTDTAPQFLTEIKALADGKDLRVPGKQSSPEILDFDYDGKKDILTGNANGQLFFYINVGTDEEPAFSGYSDVDSDGVPVDLDRNARSRPFVCFWTGSGLFGSVDAYPDILVGAGDGRVHLYRGIPIEGDTDGDGDVDDDD